MYMGELRKLHTGTGQTHAQKQPDKTLSFGLRKRPTNQWMTSLAHSQSAKTERGGCFLKHLIFNKRSKAYKKSVTHSKEQNKQVEAIPEEAQTVDLNKRELP